MHPKKVFIIKGLLGWGIGFSTMWARMHPGRGVWAQ